MVRVTPGEIHVKDSKWMDVLFAGPGHVRRVCQLMVLCCSGTRTDLDALFRNEIKIRRLLTSRAQSWVVSRYSPPSLSLRDYPF